MKQIYCAKCYGLFSFRKLWINARKAW